MSVIHSYAKALFEAAAATKGGQGMSKLCDDIQVQLDQFLLEMDSNREAGIILTAPIIAAKEKARLVSEVGTKMKLSPLVGQFLTLLASKNRLGLLRRIREEFSSVRLQAEGGVSGRLVSAEQMTPADIETLSNAFTRKLGKKVEFQVSVDPSLLAGVKVTVNGVTYDGTLRAQLDRLRNRVIVGAANA